MSRDVERLNKRNIEIRKYYKELRDVEDCGLRKYRYAYCIEKTSDEFYLAPGTIKRIVKGL